MRLVHISDTHGLERLCKRLSQAWVDLNGREFVAWVLTGDIFDNKDPSSPERERKFQRREWGYKQQSVIKRLGNKPVITVDGNHDFQSLGLLLMHCHETYRVNPGGFNFKGLKFAGFREIPWINGRWCCEADDMQLRALVDLTLSGSPDVLITHSPPRGILDGSLTKLGDHYGIAPLAIKLATTPHNVKLHCFGHVHEHGGATTTIGGTTFSNAATTVNIIEVP